MSQIIRIKQTCGVSTEIHVGDTATLKIKPVELAGVDSRAILHEELMARGFHVEDGKLVTDIDGCRVEIDGVGEVVVTTSEEVSVDVEGEGTSSYDDDYGDEGRARAQAAAERRAREDAEAKAAAETNAQQSRVTGRLRDSLEKIREALRSANNAAKQKALRQYAQRQGIVTNETCDNGVIRITVEHN
jgi:hypothetical protein